MQQYSTIQESKFANWIHCVNGAKRAKGMKIESATGLGRHQRNALQSKCEQ